MNQTNISWASVTWNPVHGCSKVSPGCDRCYAETLSLRRGWTKQPLDRRERGRECEGETAQAQRTLQAQRTEPYLCQFYERHVPPANP